MVPGTVTALPRRATKPTRSGRGRGKKGPSNPQAGRGQRGSLTGSTVVDVVAYGIPEAQGSTQAVATGVVAQAHGPELRRWRRQIQAACETAAAQLTGGSPWVAPNCPVGVIAVLTVPAPDALTRPAPADGYRDLDKLLRAVGDALCPKSGFRLLASDMRTTTTYVTKTFPAPHNTHPLALDRPGVRIRMWADTDGPHMRTIDGQQYVLLAIPDLPQPIRPA